MMLKPSPLSGQIVVQFIGGPRHGTQRALHISGPDQRVEVAMASGERGHYVHGEGAQRGKMFWRGNTYCRACGRLWTEH